MKSLKGLYPLVDWLLRISLTLVVFFTYHRIVWDLRFEEVSFYIAAIAFLGGILLIMGGLIKNNALTVVAALLIFGPVVFGIINSFHGIDVRFSSRLLRASIALYFVVSGNRMK